MPTTLGRPHRATEFNYGGNVDDGVTLLFKGNPQISSDFFQAILVSFNGQTIPGGFNMTNPTPGGFGEWVNNNSVELNVQRLTPRHASFIAAILVHEGRIESELQGNAVYLHFPEAN